MAIIMEEGVPVVFTSAGNPKTWTSTSTYLPEAMLNYLARLGWSHGDQEIFSVEEMTRLFDLKDVNAKASRLDPAKLGWLNQQYLKSDAPEDVARHLEWHLLNNGFDLAKGPRPADVVIALRDRVQTLKDMAERAAVWYRPLAIRPADCSRW